MFQVNDKEFSAVEKSSLRGLYTLGKPWTRSSARTSKTREKVAEERRHAAHMTREMSHIADPNIVEKEDMQHT